jgi:invasion protein IalB
MKLVDTLRCVFPDRSSAAVLAAVAIMVATTPAPAATRIQKTFGDWLVTCVDSGDQKHCALDTRAVTKNKVTAFIWTMAVVNKQMKSTLLVPANVSLPEGIRLSIGNANPETAPYSTCGPRWCRADLPLDAALVKKISAAQKATANFVTAGKRLVQVELNLAQFAQAYQYLYDQAGR